ncbi:MAG: hypothetical protein ABSF63_11305 [Candidatus Bathyarchaeia archaeon]
MMAKESAPSDEHQKLVGFLVERIKNEGFEIRCASYGNYAACEAIDSAIPDVRGHNSTIELTCFGEAETDATINTDHTRKQFKVFANRIMTNGKSKGQKCPFYIAVPTGSEDKLKKLLTKLGLIIELHLKWKSFPV